MSDSDLNDFDPNFNEMDWAHTSPGKEQKQPVSSGSESSERSDEDEDSVHITHDSQTLNEPALPVPKRKTQPKSKSMIIRRITMPELVFIPKIRAKVARGVGGIPKKGIEGTTGEILRRKGCVNSDERDQCSIHYCILPINPEHKPIVHGLGHGL